MSREDEYRTLLRSLPSWDEYLLRESRLPGPRGNLELAHVVADEGDRQLFDRLAAYHADVAPTNDPHEFLAFCGVLGFGTLLAEGRTEYLGRLRFHASDTRWRIREAVAMALQRYGEAHMDLLLEEMERWCGGNALERRAAIAALCEPKLLETEAHAGAVLRILDRVTESLQCETDRCSDGFRALRKGLGYCWSVAIVAFPTVGKETFAKWFATQDRDVMWVVRQNLKKR